MLKNRRALLPVVAYVLLIFAVSSVPSLRAPGPDFVSKDKVAHVVEYFILGALVFRGVGWSVSPSRVATFALLLAVCVSVAAFDEIYQGFVPGRQMSVYDWSADAIGAALGSGLFVFTRLGKRPAGTGTPGAPGETEGEAR
jgi:VanZ family protein